MLCARSADGASIHAVLTVLNEKAPLMDAMPAMPVYITLAVCWPSEATINLESMKGPVLSSPG